MKIKKGDKVIVTTGKHKGTEATVVKALPETNQVVLEGLNLKKKHVRATNSEPGQIAEFAAPIHVSNVSLIDPKSGKATRVGVDRSGKKPVRIARKSNSSID
tara:strand:+ start:207 stop:512 length:306 start_codon:yes stop_codon:yes gene_type:complete